MLRVDPLTDPTAHGGSASDAFHLVIMSMPGYGFSGKPTTTGWDPVRIARAWVMLMKRLDYTKFAAQGGHDLTLVARSREQLEALATRLTDGTGCSVKVIVARRCGLGSL